MLDKPNPSINLNFESCPSPNKPSIDLQEARRLHQYRNRSIEKIRQQKMTKDRMCLDLYELESSWNEVQYNLKRDSILNGSRERNVHSPAVPAKGDISPPKQAKGIQLYSRASVKSPKIPPPNTQNNSQNVFIFDSHLEQAKQIQQPPPYKPYKPQRNRHKAQSNINDRPFQYFNKVFAQYAPYKKQPYNQSSRKKLYQGPAEYFSIDQQKLEDPQTSNQQKYDIKEALAKQVKRLHMKRVNSHMQPKTQNSRLSISVKLFESNMEIESILFNKNAKSKLY